MRSCWEEVSPIDKSIGNKITVKITHSALHSFLDACIAAGITLHNVSAIDEITAILTVDLRNWAQFQALAMHRRGEAQVLRYTGLYWLLKNFLNRKVLLLCISTLLILSYLLPQRILFISVRGNDSLHTSQILEAAERAGLFFGVSRSSLRSESIKNQLLAQMPQLQWIGVNTRGCTATISVKEGIEEDTDRRSYPNTNIIASRDGIIHTLHVMKGTAVCSVGQAVKAGELLISSYTDCGNTIRISEAEGEIYAETLRQVECIIPSIRFEKGDFSRCYQKFSLRIGKKRINLFKDSGIYTPTCDKMYKEYYLTLPGGFKLPIVLEVEQWQLFNASSVLASPPMATEAMKTFGADYLLQEMIAGKILSSELEISEEDAACRITGSYRCIEMIGRVQQEEITLSYGKND